MTGPDGWADREFWRWWKVTYDGVLASPIGSFRWEAADFHAGCLHGAAGKPVNERECWCGVYAFTHPDHCHTQAKSTKMFAPHAMDPARFAGVVIGRVQLSSDAYLAKPARIALPEEWMASACRITRLYACDALAEALASRYGVPVEYPSQTAGFGNTRQSTPNQNEVPEMNNSETLAERHSANRRNEGIPA